jgi:integrase/recombinase XerD
LVGQIGAINSKKSRRLLLIIRLLYETGIRSNELLSINKQDINNNEIIIKGKGNKERIIYLSLNLKELLYEYINNGHIDGLLFKFKYKNLYKMISSLSKYLNKKISPHSFRRGFASYCINRNTNLYTLSQMMGHVDLNTTKNYICNYSYAHEMSNLFN